MYLAIETGSRLVSVEEIEELLGCGVRDVDLLAVKFPDLVTQKQTAVQIWYLSEQSLRFGRPVLLRKSFEEEDAKKIRIEAVLAALLCLREL